MRKEGQGIPEKDYKHRSAEIEENLMRVKGVDFFFVFLFFLFSFCFSLYPRSFRGAHPGVKTHGDGGEGRGVASLSMRTYS